MLNVNYSQISLYCSCSKIIKRSGTSFQSPGLSQKQVRNVFHTTHKYLTKFHRDNTQNSEEVSLSVTFIM